MLILAIKFSEENFFSNFSSLGVGGARPPPFCPSLAPGLISALTSPPLKKHLLEWKMVPQVQVAHPRDCFLQIALVEQVTDDRDGRIRHAHRVQLKHRGDHIHVF